MLAVDTNVLVRLIARDDAAQVRAAEEFVAKGAWVSHLILAETIWVLDSVYELPRERIATAVDMLLNHQELTLQDADVVRAALLHFQRHPKVRILRLPGPGNRVRKAGHIPLATFDRDFAKLADVERLT